MRSIINLFQRFIDYYQGIGYGTATISKELKSIKKFIPNGNVFVDVGGNKGLYSAEILKLFQVKEVHIFEPSLCNVKLLNEKFKENNKVWVNDLGLSNVSGNKILYSNESGSGLSSLTKRNLDHFGIDFSVEEQIKLIRFDEYAGERILSKVIDLVKIDVEGHELEVLEGIGDRIKSIKIIQFEFGGCNIDTKTYFQNYWYFFKKNNFDIYRITPFGVLQIKQYREEYERFQTTNYFCVNKGLF